MQLLFFYETEEILWFLHGSGCLNPNGGVRGGAGECVCIIDGSTGSGERRARAASLKQHQGGMQGPEMGRSTKNHTIL